MQKAMVLLVFGLLWIHGFSQKSSILGKSVLTNVASASVFLDGGAVGHNVLQSIGQSGNLASVSTSGHLVQQGFLNSFQLRYAKDFTNGDRTDAAAILYPNPAIDRVNIYFGKMTDGPVKVRVFDMSGRHIMGERFEQSKNLTLDIANLQEATYIIQAMSGGRTWSFQVIKQDE